jgi:hypothetical protein
MHQQPLDARLPEMSFPAVNKIRLWLEEEDKEESKRIGKLKEQQKQRQKLFEEQLRQRQQQDSRSSEPLKPSPPR